MLPVTEKPFRPSPAGGDYQFYFQGQPFGTVLTVPAKTMPVNGDNLLLKTGPDVLYNKALGIGEDYEYIYDRPGFVVCPLLPVVPGSVITSNKGIYSGCWYNAQKQWIGKWLPSYSVKGTVPAGAFFFRPCYDGLGTFKKAGIFMGDFGGGERMFAPEPYGQAWFEEPDYAAARTRSQWNIRFLGVLGSTTKDDRFSQFPESGYNTYRGTAASTYGLVCAKGFNENAAILVVHPWGEINRRRALYTNINGECPDVASNGTHAFAIVNGNNRATYTQKWIAVIDVATQNPVEVTGGVDLVGYGPNNDQVGYLSKTMAWQGHQVPTPNTGNDDDWKYQRELYVNTWKYSGIAAEQGLNKLVAVSCAAQGYIEIRRYPNNAVVDTINVALPRKMDFTPDGALWVVCGEDYALPYNQRTGTILRKYVNQGTDAAPDFQQVQQTAIPFLAGVMAEADNTVFVGMSGLTMQYQHVSSSGALIGTPHGSLGGNTATATVTDTVYTLLNHEPLEDGDWENYISFSSRAPDGSIWIGNPGGFEIRHWNANMTTHLKEDRIGYFADFFDLALDRGKQTGFWAQSYWVNMPSWYNVRSAFIAYNYRLLLPKYLLSPHCCHTYTSQDGQRQSQIIFCQDTRFHDGQPSPYPNGAVGNPGYHCEMIRIPPNGGAPERSGQYFEFEPNTGKTWTLYPEGIRTFHNYEDANDNWRVRVLFRAYIDLDAQGFPMFGPQVTLKDEQTWVAGQYFVNPRPVPGWNRQYTCPMLPNGAFVGLETAYQKLGAHHVGYWKDGVTGYFKKLLPNKSMKDPLPDGSYNVPFFWPDIDTATEFGGHFSAGVDVAGPLAYIFQDGQFSKYKSNATTVYDQDGNPILEFGRQQDEGPGFDSQNLDAYAYGNNCGQARAMELPDGNHVVLRATENAGGYHLYINYKPTAAPAS